MFKSTGRKPHPQKIQRRLRKRSQLQLESLERRDLMATMTWDGGAGTANWADANNWDVGGSNPAAAPGAADIAVFDGLGNAGALAINLGGVSRSVQQLNFTNDATRGYTLFNGSVATTSISQTGAGTNTLAAQIAAGGAQTVSVSAGKLVLASANNQLDNADNINVSGGTLTFLATGSLGTANLNLSGGTTQLGLPLTLINPGDGAQSFAWSTAGGVPNLLDANLYVASSGTIGRANINGDGFPIQNLGASSTRTFAQNLQFTDDNAMSAFFSNSQINSTTNLNYAATFTGNFTAPMTGDYVFRFDRHDDNAAVWVDLNNNGLFELGNNERLLDVGCCSGGASATRTLTGGQTYKVAFAVEETGGGSNFGMQIATTPTFNVPGVNVNVTGNATLTAAMTLATVSNINIGAGANLTVNGGALTFNNLTTAANSTLTASGGAVIVNGAATLNGNTTINDSAAVTINGAVTGAGGLAKAGTGILALTNAGNTYAGATSISGGILRINNSNSLGSTAAGTTVTGGTLEINGSNLSIAEPLNIFGAGTGNVGAINSIGGNNTITSPIAAGGSATIGSATAGSKLTLSGDLSTFPVSTLTFTGAGDIDVLDSFGNGSAPITANALIEKWYPNVFADTNLIIDANAANNTDTYLALAPDSTTLLTSSLGNFSTAQLVARSPSNLGAFGNKFGATWSGTLTVGGALAAGPVSFGTNTDDGSAIYVDANQNGQFESSELVVDNRGGHGAQSRTGTVTLAAGNYGIYIAYYESSGGGSMEARFAAGNGVAYGSQTIINPGDPAQNGIFSSTLTPNVAVIKNGTGTLALAAANTYNGATTINGGRVVASNSNSLGLAGGDSVRVNAGASLALQNNITVTENIVANGTGISNSGAIANVSGNNFIVGSLTAVDASQGELRLGSAAGTLTVNGNVDARFSRLTVDGAGNVVINGNVSGVGGASLANGLRHYGYNTNNDNLLMNLNNNGGMVNTAGVPYGFNSPPVGGATFVNSSILLDGPGGRGLDFNDDSDFQGTGNITNGDNYSNLFIGVLNVTAANAGNWTFQNNPQDDPTGLWIDLNQNGIFESNGSLNSNNGEQILWNTTGVSSAVNLPAGQYLIAWTHREGGGGSQIEAHFILPSGVNQVVRPNDPAQSGMWLTPYLADNRLVKTGAGTLTVNGTNSLNAATQVNGGALADNGIVKDQVAVASGATLSAGVAGSVGTLSIGQGPYRFYRFVPTAFRNPAITEEQISELQVFLNTTRIPAVAVTNPGGNNPATEQPANVNDNDFGTKWLDFNKGNLVLDMGAPTAIDSYRLGTANDSPGRDPVRWRFEGSNDGSAWTVLDDHSGADFPTTFTRNTAQTAIDIPLGGLTINANGHLQADIGAAAADTINVNGAVFIGANATLDLQFIAATAPSVGAPLTLINNDGSDAISGTFAGIPNVPGGTTLTIGGRSVTVNYAGGDGNDLTLTLNPTAPTITFVGTAIGLEDNPALPPTTPAPNQNTRIPLGIVVNNVDTGATTTVVISGIPQSSGAGSNGARLVNAAGVPYAQSPAGTVTLTNVANGTLNVFLEKDDNRPLSPFNLSITASSVPTAGGAAAVSAPVTRSVSVNNSAPQASISGPSTVGRGSNTFFTFEGLDAPGDIATGMRYVIDWGDGTGLTDSNVTDTSKDIAHAYNGVGNFTITLTVIDDENAASTVEEFPVVVSAIFVDDEGNLIINGTSSADRIVLSNSAGGLQARINNVLQQPMSPEGGTVKIFGFGGADNITVNGNVVYPVEIYGGDGNDYIAGGTQADLLDGGNGNDRILGGNGDDILLGGDGNDTLNGGNGNDALKGDGFVDEFGDIQDGDTGGNDTLSGDNGDDTAEGGMGNDRVNGGNGNDLLFGQDGSDRMDGGAGDDLLMGNDGSDTMYGQAGIDVLIGGNSGDTLYGGAGDDLMLGDDMDPLDAQDLYVAWSQNSGTPADLLGTFSVTADDAPDTLYGQGGSDWFLAFLNDRVRDFSASSDTLDRDAI